MSSMCSVLFVEFLMLVTFRARRSFIVILGLVIVG